MVRAFELAHLLLRHSIEAGDQVLDATVGNGLDTLFLCELVGPGGCVIGFDVQERALASAHRLLGKLPQVTLVHCGHEHLEEHLPVDARGQLSAVMFNLGYLPGGCKDIVTCATTTLAALEQAARNVKIGGVITIVAYPGHGRGAQEACAVRAYCERLSGAFSVSRHARINALQPAPELIVIERVR